MKGDSKTELAKLAQNGARKDANNLALCLLIKLKKCLCLFQAFNRGAWSVDWLATASKAKVDLKSHLEVKTQRRDHQVLA